MRQDQVTALDSKNLARLHRVADPRTVWASEAGDFTPWLAENIDALADELGIALTVVSTEVSVGDFRLDIHAEDEQGRTVVIENQLERTDHGHLGQTLIYAAGLDAGTIVWVAPHFREEYRNALDWLNERTDKNVGFFGVEISLVKIEEGPMAPVFEVVARPNEWSKAVKAKTTTSVTPLNAARQELFADVLEEVVVTHPVIKVPKPANLNYLTFASGPFGYWALSIDKSGRMRVEAYLDKGNGDLNKALFDELHTGATKWEAAAGFAFSWERLEDARASRIAAYSPTSVDLDDDVSREQTRMWGVEALSKMFAALNTSLRARAADLKRQHSAAEQTQADAVSAEGSISP